jgi:glycosyltransferase involved in cell wall biosynthesis
MTSSLTARTVESDSSGPSAMNTGSRRFAGRRIAMVTFSPFPFDPRPRRCVDALVSEGAQIDLICLAHGNDARRETLNGVNVLRIPLKHPRRGKLEYGLRYGAFIFITSVIFALRSLVRRYDLVYVHNMPDILVLSSVIPKALGARVVLDLHDPMPELMKAIFGAAEENSSVRWMKRLEKWSIARVDLVVTVNIACKRIFSGRSCPAEKIAVVMNAPDGQIFPQRTVQTNAMADRAGDKPFVIMYHGSLVERNGLDVAVDALVQVKRVIPNVELRVYGTHSAFLDQMMEKARSKGVDDVIHYLGRKQLEDLVPEIDKCDLGIIPNHRNAFTDINTPTRMFEYLAMGKPLIAPSTQGIEDYFSKESLLFFEPGNSDDLAQQIEYAYFHPREMMDILRRGREVYLQHTWERERETLLGRVSETLNKR